MKFDRKYLLALLPLFLVVIIFVYFSDIVTYIVLAWVLSLIGAPLMAKFLKFFGRNTAAVLTLLSFVFLIIVVSYVFIPPIVQQTKNLANIDYNNLFISIEEPIHDWNNWLVNKGLMEAPPETIDTKIQDQEHNRHQVHTEIVALDSLNIGRDSTTLLPSIALVIHIDNNQVDIQNAEEQSLQESFVERVKKNIYEWINPNRVNQLLAALFGIFGNIVVAIMSIFFIGFFFLREQGLFMNIISSFIPDEYEGRATHALDEMTSLLVRYFIGIVIQVMIITLFVSLALTILGVKNALLIGFFAALMNVIPYIGPLIGAMFAMIITISSNIEVSFYDALLPVLIKVLIVFGIMQLMDNFILQPTIYGKSVKAHPLEIFIVVLVGAKLGGVLGMILAIPIYTVIRVVGKVFLSEFKIIQRITKNI